MSMLASVCLCVCSLRVSFQNTHRGRICPRLCPFLRPPNALPDWWLRTWWTIHELYLEPPVNSTILAPRPSRPSVQFSACFQELMSRDVPKQPTVLDMEHTLLDKPTWVRIGLMVIRMFVWRGVTLGHLVQRVSKSLSSSEMRERLTCAQKNTHVRM